MSRKNRKMIAAAPAVVAAPVVAVPETPPDVITTTAAATVPTMTVSLASDPFASKIRRADLRLGNLDAAARDLVTLLRFTANGNADAHGPFLNPTPRVTAAYDVAPCFISGPARPTMTARRALEIVDYVLNTAPDSAVAALVSFLHYDARYTLADGTRRVILPGDAIPDGAVPYRPHNTTRPSDLEIADCRVRIVGPLLRYVDGRTDRMLPGAFGRTETYADRIAHVTARYHAACALTH